ncbi:Serine/threonine-protein kinase NIM1 [Clarias magur]|uniref:Serine/threonine-protein kinase NIM1 n=1 Tax=Clarias magur TaxID=1594786 RepID=A0A8J4U534_CLAMG|nr:Serine/threonine-protein kinase NIM1 [Clarias magur]
MPETTAERRGPVESHRQAPELRPCHKMLRKILQPASHPRKQAGFVVEAEMATPSAPVASLAHNDCLFRK